MKKLLSIILSAVIILNAAPIVYAVDNALADDLTAVTEKVKNQVDVSSDFTNFIGGKDESGEREAWHLSWENDDGEYLNIDATNDGKIMRYSASRKDDSYRYDNNYAPTFPKLSRDDAKKIAENFLKRIINTSKEGFEISDNNYFFEARNISDYSFNGNITFSGIKSSIGFSVRVNVLTKSVTFFLRDDYNTKYIGEVPSSKAEVSKDFAEKLLNGKVKLELIYTTDIDSNNKLDEGKPKKAVLRYKPIIDADYLVDAHTGKLINLSELYKELEDEPASNEFAADGAAKSENKLTDVEKEGIEKISGVNSKEQLDKAARAFTEFGLDGFSLNHAFYYINNDDEYYCSLDYSKIESKDKITYKYITMNAKTKELRTLYTHYSYDKDDTKNKKLSKEETQKKAEQFLSKYFKDKFDKTKLYNSYDDISIYSRNNKADKFNFAQQENGYFFPENAFDVEVNADLGTIDSFNSYFSDVVFDSADGVVSMEKALDAYNSAFNTKLTYANVPKKLDLTSPEFEPFIRRGYKYLYELKLAYVKETDIWPYGVDAKTGKVLTHTNNEKEKLTYKDINNEKEILALAEYGIGFDGDKFEKSKKLTQKDMLTLLVSANDGHIYRGDNTDDLYQTAYNLGILKKEERNDNKQITRAELVKTIISMSGYGKTADLSGIYICSFKDKKDIPSKYYGYVAIAQGLELIKSGENISFMPNMIATREQAAIILYNFMNRKN